MRYDNFRIQRKNQLTVSLKYFILVLLLMSLFHTSILSEKTRFGYPLGVLASSFFAGAFCNAPISAGPQVRCFPAHLSLRTILRVPGERRVLRQDIQAGLDYLVSRGYKVTGDPFTRMVVTVNRNRPEFVRYYEMWFPIDRI